MGTSLPHYEPMPALTGELSPRLEGIQEARFPAKGNMNSKVYGCNDAAYQAVQPAGKANEVTWAYMTSGVDLVFM